MGFALGEWIPLNVTYQVPYYLSGLSCLLPYLGQCSCIEIQEVSAGASIEKYKESSRMLGAKKDGRRS